MSHSIKQLIGHELGASDGEVGHLKDFYFDDQKWVVRYAVVDAGSWLAQRQVLISPLAFGQLKVTGKIVRVNLNRKQIEKCPPIEAHKTVSRQYEEEYYRHYGWPGYWQGEGLWGVSPFPIVELPPKSRPKRPLSRPGPFTRRLTRICGAPNP